MIVGEVAQDVESRQRTLFIAAGTEWAHTEGGEHFAVESVHLTFERYGRRGPWLLAGARLHGHALLLRGGLSTHRTLSRDYATGDGALQRFAPRKLQTWVATRWPAP